MTVTQSNPRPAHVNGRAPAAEGATHAASVGAIRKILALLTPAERRRGLLVILMSIGMAFLELAGVASVLPFLAVLGNPAMIEQNELLALAYKLGGFESANRFLLVLGVGAFVVVVVSSLFRALTLYVINRYTQMRTHSIGYRLLQGYLGQPYPFFLHRNSADLAKSILSETSQVVISIFRPAMQIITYTPVIVALIILLVLMDPTVAALVASVVALVYALIFVGVRTLLGRLGRERLASNQARFTTVNEALGGIKELKVLGRELAFLRRFQIDSIRFSRHQATSTTVSQIPKNLIEAVAFGGVLGLALVLMTTRQDLGEVLPILGLYAFAGYRLLPAVQQIYAGFAALRFGTPALDAVYADLQLHQSAQQQSAAAAPFPPLTRGIRFEHVSFRYPGVEQPVLRELNLEIPVNTTVAFVGSTGSGKTTAVDLILGLLTPNAGEILLDDAPLGPDTVRAWQQRIGYVPQSIYLADATVAENIAFGLAADKIELDAVEAAARIANIHDFVVEELPQGYDTLVGERGVRLSGGQRQRIGIARALYHNPDVLVMDEATSALDNATEAAVMAAVRRLSGQKTIILVAHRFSTVEKADAIFVFEQGRVVASGAYETLLEANSTFRKLAGELIG